MPFITTKDGAELYWHEWGAGAPILFLNGLGSPSCGCSTGCPGLAGGG
jgi:pimeloyl-ACP methyl ester carboxylesterase